MNLDYSEALKLVGELAARCKGQVPSWFSITLTLPEGLYLAMLDSIPARELLHREGRITVCGVYVVRSYVGQLRADARWVDAEGIDHCRELYVSIDSLRQLLAEVDVARE